MPGQTEGQTEEQTDGRKDAWKDGQTLFHRTFWANAGGSKKKFPTFPDFLAAFDGSLIVPYFFQNSQKSQDSRFRVGLLLPLLPCDS